MLNDLIPNEQKITNGVVKISRASYSFLYKKDYRQKPWSSPFLPLLPNNIKPIDVSLYGIIISRILQEIFSCVWPKC